MISRSNIPIIIVGYRNAEDIVECLAALQTLVPDPKFDVYICENGGAAAFDTLTSALVGGQGPCVQLVSPPQLPTMEQRFVRVQTIVLRGVDALVTVAEADSNLGYAGGINAWLRVLKEVSGWLGVLDSQSRHSTGPSCACRVGVVVEHAKTRNGGQSHSQNGPAGPYPFARPALALSLVVGGSGRLPGSRGNRTRCRRCGAAHRRSVRRINLCHPKLFE